MHEPQPDHPTPTLPQRRRPPLPPETRSRLLDTFWQAMIAHGDEILAEDRNRDQPEPTPEQEETPAN